ncbi:type IX secretion system protein PorD [Ferruginibacter sp.]
MRKLFFLFLLTFATGFLQAQELKATVTIVSSQVGNAVNPSVFKTLQTALNNFMNNRKWTTDVFLPNEKITCSFLLNLEPTADLNVYSASLTIQAARPIFNTSYLSPIINFRDENVTFKYAEFQQLDFNENRVSGSDGLVSNLTAVFAYYANMILAFDYDSFSPRGGDVYFQKAQNIVNNAPDGRGISGWKAFDGVRNRYWLVENMLNSRYTLMHDVYYNYYRLGMDKFYEDENTARAEVMNVLNLLNNFNTENPNKMINQFFFQGKSTELVKLFSKAPQQDKMRASELLQKMDITNANKYKDELK